MEQDWGITFHQGDSFILGYLGSEAGTSHSSKDRLRAAENRVEKKFERSSNPIPSPKGHLWHICLTCSHKPSKTKCLWSISQGVLRVTTPRMWKEASLAPSRQRSCTAQLPLVSPQAANLALWESWLRHFPVPTSYKSKDSPFGTNPLTHTSTQKVLSGSQESRCWAWSILYHVGGFRPSLSFLIISVSNSIQQIRHFQQSWVEEEALIHTFLNKELLAKSYALTILFFKFHFVGSSYLTPTHQCLNKEPPYFFPSLHTALLSVQFHLDI